MMGDILRETFNEYIRGNTNSKHTKRNPTQESISLMISHLNWNSIRISNSGMDSKF